MDHSGPQWYLVQICSFLESRVSMKLFSVCTMEKGWADIKGHRFVHGGYSLTFQDGSVAQSSGTPRGESPKLAVGLLGTLNVNEEPAQRPRWAARTVTATQASTCPRKKTRTPGMTSVCWGQRCGDQKQVRRGKGPRCDFNGTYSLGH